MPLSNDDIQILVDVYNTEAKGFGGMFTGRRFHKRVARRLERDGYLRRHWLDVVNEHEEVTSTRLGFALTDKGLDAVPEDERWAGLIDTA